MGCCVSTKQKQNNPVVSDSPHVTKKPLPPPLTAALEPVAPEETVKEVVLSETPITTPPIKQPHSVTRSAECSSSTQMKTPQDRDHGPNGPLTDESVDGSEFNFMFTLTTMTTTRNPIVQRRDEERKEVVLEGMQSRVSPTAKRVYSGDVLGANGAATRTAVRMPMPEQQRRIDHGGRVRRVTGEVGGERTRWEGKRVNLEMGSAVGVRKRVPVVGQSRDVAVDISGSGAARGRDGDGMVPESFENPLVSLECFIFL